MFQIGNIFNAQTIIPSPDSYVGFPVFLQKPAHVLLLALFSLFSKNDILRAVHYSVCFGLASIVLVAQIGRKWISPATGLLAALWLAFQPSHVHYSRLALHESDSMTIFLLMLLIWKNPKHAVKNSCQQMISNVFTGFLGIAALGASYRYLPYLAIAALAEFVLTRQYIKSFHHRLCRWGGIFLGAIGCFILFNWSYRILFVPHYLWSQPASYFSVLKIKFFSSESSFDLEYPLYYLKTFIGFDGLLPTISWLLALAFLLFYKHEIFRKIGIWIVFPLLIFSVTTTRVPRTVTGIYPFIAIAWGAGIATAWGNLKIRYRSRFIIPVFIILIACICGAMLNRLPAIWSLQSGYPDVVKWLDKQEQNVHLSTMYPIYAVYQGRHAVKPVPFSLEEITYEVEHNHTRYLTVDWQKFLRYSRGVYEIEKAALPIFAVNHNPGSFFASLYENHLPSDVPMLRQDPTLHYIKVYDLYDVLPKMGYPLSFLEINHE